MEKRVRLNLTFDRRMTAIIKNIYLGPKDIGFFVGFLIAVYMVRFFWLQGLEFYT